MIDNKLTSVAFECVHKASSEIKYVVPVFTTVTYCDNFYFEAEASDFIKEQKHLPKYERVSVDLKIKELNEKMPYGIFFLGNDDISYGMRCKSAQEVEDYLSLGKALGELDLMWRN